MPPMAWRQLHSKTTERKGDKKLKGMTWKESRAEKPVHFLLSITLSEMQTAI